MKKNPSTVSSRLTNRPEGSQILPRVEESFLLKCLAEILGLEKDLEVMKINLSLREDFNLIDAYALLDVKGKSTVSRTEMRNALLSFKVCMTDDDLDLLFSQYSIDGSVLTYSNFSDAFLPKDQHYLK